MLISVIIPVFNSGNSAINAVNSILIQSPSYVYEVIIVDDCSTDNSVEYLKKNIKTRDNILVKYVLHDKNSGVGAARNSGIQVAIGQYFALLDSDDVWLEGKIESQIQFLESNPPYVMVGSLTNMPGSFIPPFVASKKQIDISVYHQCFKCFFQPSTVVIRTSQFKTNFVWPSKRCAEEGDVFLRLANKYKICLQNKIFVNYSGGKRGFGHSGLSKNIFNSQSMELANLRMAYNNNYINIFVYIIAVSFSCIKFVRRIVITKLNP
jgi:glycosyltransferase involved in cell wall biosynthesis